MHGNSSPKAVMVHGVVGALDLLGDVCSTVYGGTGSPTNWVFKACGAHELKIAVLWLFCFRALCFNSVVSEAVFVASYLKQGFLQQVLGG